MVLEPSGAPNVDHSLLLGAKTFHPRDAPTLYQTLKASLAPNVDGKPPLETGAGTLRCQLNANPLGRLRKMLFS
jgi:hypothetical protein